jgi:hypothetical protein
MNHRLIVSFGIIIVSALPISANISGRDQREKNMSGNNFSSALQAPERSKEVLEQDDLYGWLIGTWDIDFIDYLAVGTKIEGKGVWYFSRVLEGRAVQDVLISLPRPDRVDQKSQQRNTYGSSIRYYDRNISAWRVIWVNPITSTRNDLVARREGNDIVQEGEFNGQKIRWSFKEVSPTSFRWLGEALEKGGMTWKLQAEFRGRRRFPNSSG